jgi:GNAT superfamily N-acetyltransferase
MQITCPTDADWPFFLDWAHREGWRVPANELALFRGPLAECAFVLTERGEPRGFVTAVRHERSGWVGNLIVPPDLRGRGCGALLLRHALDILWSRGAESIWLTASDLGRPIYEKLGFRRLDRIRRYTLIVREGGGGSSPPGGGEELLQGDCRVWDESRPLLHHLALGGFVAASGGTTALLQEGKSMRVIGPWLSRESCPRENRLILTALLSAAAPGTELTADILESSPVGTLLAAAGFAPRGSTDLMVMGSASGVRLSQLVALASLGSMG